MGLWSKIKSFFIKEAKVKISDIVNVLNAIDENHDGEITIPELVGLVKRLALED